MERALTSREQATAAAALRLAELVYREDAAKLRCVNEDRMAEQFERQALDAMKLYDAICG